MSVKQIDKNNEHIEIRLSVTDDMTLVNITLIANYSMQPQDIEDALKFYLDGVDTENPNEDLN